MPVRISTDTGGRLVDIINRRHGADDGITSTSGYANQPHRPVAIIQCGAAVDTPDLAGVYEGTPVVCDPADGSWDSYDDCYIWSDGHPITNASKYQCYLYGEHTETIDDEDDTRLLWVTVGGSGGVEIVKIRLDCQWKDPIGRSPWASPLCALRGVIQSCSARYGYADGQDCWWVIWSNYNYASFPPLAGCLPPTPVLADGNGAHYGKFLGFSYDFQRDDGHGGVIQGPMLPVYGSTEYSAAYAFQCVTDESGIAQIQPVLGG